MELGRDASRSNVELDAVVSEPNMRLGSDMFAPNIEFGVGVLQPNLGLDTRKGRSLILSYNFRSLSFK